MNANDDGRVDLTDLNKTKKQFKFPALKNPFKKQVGPKRDEVGKFTSGSGGLITAKHFKLSRVIPIAVIVALAGGFLVFRSFATTTLLGNDGEYVPLKSARIYDTRTAGSKLALAAGKSVQVPVATKGGVPADAGAVVVNVTAVAPAVTGYARVWPGGEAMPVISQLNYFKGQSIANEIVVPIGKDGTIQLFTSGAAHYVFDVTGYMASQTGQDGLRFNAMTSTRLYDSRTVAPKASLGAGKTVSFIARGKAGIPLEARAIVVNVTAVTPTASGYARIWPGGTAMPATSQINFYKGQSVANELIVPMGVNGDIQIWNNTGNTHYVVDVAGYYMPEEPGYAKSQQGRYVPFKANRVYDTRSAGSKQPIGAGQSTWVQLPTALVPSDATAAIVNITAVSPTASGYSKIWPMTYPKATMPATSQINFYKGQSITNEVIVPLSSGSNGIQIWNNAGSTHYVADIVGYISSDPTYANSYVQTSIENTDRSQESYFSKIEYDYVANNTPSDDTFSSTTEYPGFDATKDGNFYPPAGWNWPLSQRFYYNATPVGGTARSNYISYDCNPSSSCVVLHPKGKIRTSALDWGYVDIPILKKGTKYQFSRVLEVDQPGRPGIWELISATYDGKKEDLIRHKVVEKDSGIKFGYRGSINITSSSSTNCKSPSKYSWSFSNLLADGQVFNVGSYGFSPQGEYFDYCPGLTKTDFVGAGISNRKLFTHTLGVLKAERDVEPPVIQSVEISDDRILTVQSSDSQGAVVDISAIEDSLGIGFGWRASSNTYSYDKNATRKFIIERYPESLPVGEYKIRITVKDTSGNIAEELKAITLK